MPEVDLIKLNFSPASLMILNGILGLVMFGIALDIRVADFKAVLRRPLPVFIGLFAQFFVLPAATFGLVWLLNPLPSIGLGMMLVAACPGGNISNFITHLAKGNVALSVTMSAISTVAAMVMTPFNIAFWGSMHPGTRSVLKQVALNPMDLFLTVVVLLGIPLALGLFTSRRWPTFTARVRKPMKIFSILFFISFLAAALAANFSYFLHTVGTIAFVVVLHNATALASGYLAARAARLSERDRRAVAIEVGIQNSGLGLVLIFNFFGGLGGMAIITALWGIWHGIAGLALASYWGRRPPLDDAAIGGRNDA